jgi:hypothetical protein
MKRFLMALAGTAALAGLSYCNPHDVDADPNKDYPITPAAGPWMICVTSFMGPESGKLAHDMVLELRQQYKIAAYFFNRGEEERKKHELEIQQKRQQQEDNLRRAGLNPADANFLRIRTVRIEDQFAVLVGGYKDMDTARKALDDIKKLKPPSERLSATVLHITEPTQAKDSKKTVTEKSYLNPFLSSFVVPNPTVPVQREPEKPDKFLKELNSNESYSLLNCRKPWTLAVRDFQGAQMIQQPSEPSSFMEKLKLDDKTSERLNAAALQAHEVARVLRQMHFDAYVLHTRHMSLVTIGGFDSPNDPQISQAQRQLAQIKSLNSNAGLTLMLWANPLPMEVPRP